jgi:SAM-dependent methyltransferase
MEDSINGGDSTAIINDYQKQIYEEVERNTVDRLIGAYKDALEAVKGQSRIKILDIGGASGYFSSALRGYFSENGCEIFVVDNTRYDTWEKFADKITFIEDSAENIGKIFSENTFDMVFANRVFHHIVQKNYKDTVSGVTGIVGLISKILKDDGVFCFTEHLYNGLLFDAAASRVIYTLTSCKIPLFVKIIKRIEAKSAGVGVCYLSKKMWTDIFDKCGFVVGSVSEGNKMSWTFLRAFVYGILLSIKSHRLNVSMILRKK